MLTLSTHFAHFIIFPGTVANLGTAGNWLSKVSGTDGQNVLYPGQPTPTPAPGAIVMLASGGLFAGAFGKFRRQSKTVACDFELV
jgi:hypothetical protein